MQESKQHQSHAGTQRTLYLAANCFSPQPQFERQMVFSLGFTTTCSKQPSVMMWGLIHVRCMTLLPHLQPLVTPQIPVFSEGRGPASILHLGCSLSAFSQELPSVFLQPFVQQLTWPHKPITALPQWGKIKIEVTTGLILRTVLITYPFLALGCQNLIVLLKQALIFLT